LQSNILTDDFNYDIILEKLRLLCDYYKWKEEDSKKLRYYAALMNGWISSKPLKKIIEESIKHYKRKGKIFEEDTREFVPFTDSNPKHINIVVNEVIADIENILRFELKRYFDNYYNILVEKLGEENAGVNWADYLEYGTSDKKIIELQNIGIPRHLSQYILKNHENCLTFNEQNNLSEIDRQLLEGEFDKTKHEYKECEELSLYITPKPLTTF
jgi:hypothetical protein